MDFIVSKLRESYAQQKPFVCYCKPNSNQLIGLFSRVDTAAFTDDLPGFVMVSFDGTQRFKINQADSDLYFETIVDSDFFLENSQPNYLDADKERFEQAVAKAVNAIADGAFHKVVLSRKETLQQAQSDPWQSFQKLIHSYPTAFRYLWFHPQTGFWMGATPEQLLKKEGDLLKTVALAGTQEAKETVDVTWGQKEVEEQQWVTDYILASLQPFSTEIQHSKPYTHKAGSLVHIKTDIAAKGIDDWQSVVKALHPTPAVCGFPKEAAFQFIKENEGYDRSFYAGYLGEWNTNFSTFQKGVADLYVNLRCMQWENSQVHIYVGCGINAGSEPEKEFLETVHKAVIVKRAL
ncbi:MAG: hypothetical protein RL607_947 [Bacteroidota bacterium]|jgi:isochorismate synthase